MTDEIKPIEPGLYCFYLSIGYGEGASHREEIQVPEDLGFSSNEWAAISPDRQKLLMNEEHKEWVNGHIDACWYSAKKGDRTP